MNKWHTDVLGNLAAPYKSAFATGPFGSSVSARNFRESGVPMLRGSNLSEDISVRLDPSDMVFIDEDLANKFSRSTVGVDDLVFTCWGTIGQVGLIDPTHQYDRYVISNKQMKMTPDPMRANSLFLYYYLSQPAMIDLVKGQAIGSSVPGFNLGQLRRLPVRIPDLTYQRAIAEVLGALDDKIAANIKLETTAELYFAQLYREATAGDCQSRPLFDVVEVQFGEPFSGSHFSEPGSGRQLIRIRDLKTFRCQTWTTESRLREIVVKPGDILVGMDAEFRVTSWLGESGLLNQRVCQVASPTLGPVFVKEALREPLLEIENAKTGTTVIHLNKSDMARIVINVPFEEELDRIRSRSDALYDMRIRLGQERAALATTRDLLLPQLMSGKLRVKDAEKQVEAVV